MLVFRFIVGKSLSQYFMDEPNGFRFPDVNFYHGDNKLVINLWDEL